MIICVALGLLQTKVLDTLTYPSLAGEMRIKLLILFYLFILFTNVRCSPVEDPGVRLISQADVVLRQQARQPGGQRGPVHPALTGATLVHWRHEDKIPRNQL